MLQGLADNDREPASGALEHADASENAEVLLPSAPEMETFPIDSAAPAGVARETTSDSQTGVAAAATSAKIAPDARKKLTGKGFSRRIFNRTAAATGVLAVAAAGMTTLAVTHAQENTSVRGTAQVAGTQSAAQPSQTQGIYQYSQVQTLSSGKLREYWIQADSFLHNLVPGGVDGMSGMTYPANETSYQAIGYRAYTANWETPLPGDNNIGGNTGIPGPVLRAEVGDTIRVHFRNNDTYYKFCHSMHPHGVAYTPANDGSWTALDSTKPGTNLKVGETFTYEWTVAPSSVGSWPYHDHAMPATIPGSSSTSNESAMNPSNGIMELGAELGLFGMLVITDSKTPVVDREFILCFHDLYEADIPQLSQDFDCFNGYAFLGNTPAFEAKVGERVRWRIMALGQDFHVFHLHGHRWLYNGRYDDACILGPSTTLTFDYVEDNPGTWLYHCHVTEHMMGGMVGTYISK